MRWIYTFFVSITVLMAGNAQTVYFSAGAEKTATKCLYGGGLTFETKSKWGFGAFYQASIMDKTDEVLELSNVFYGVLGQVPLAKTNKIDFFATVRVGMVNQDFFVAVPGLETRIQTWRKLSTVFSMSYRTGYPAVGLKIAHPVF